MTQFPRSKPDLLFDVDGVLVYPAMRFRDFLLRHHGITPEMTAPFFHGPFLECATGRANLSDELEVCLAPWGWSGTTSQFIEIWMREDSTPDSAMLELVASLRNRGWKCHVASVQEHHRAAYLRDTIGFRNAFDQTFFSCDLGVAKPDPQFYISVQQQLGKPPEELMLIDDSRACIEAARDAGWRTFHYNSPTDRAQLIAAIGI